MWGLSSQSFDINVQKPRMNSALQLYQFCCCKLIWDSFLNSEALFRSENVVLYQLMSQTLCAYGPQCIPIYHYCNFSTRFRRHFLILHAKGKGDRVARASSKINMHFCCRPRLLLPDVYVVPLDHLVLKTWPIFNNFTLPRSCSKTYYKHATKTLQFICYTQIYRTIVWWVSTSIRHLYLYLPSVVTHTCVVTPIQQRQQFTTTMSAQQSIVNAAPS